MKGLQCASMCLCVRASGVNTYMFPCARMFNACVLGSVRLCLYVSFMHRMMNFELSNSILPAE